YQVMKALRQVRFSGAVEPDHVPQLAGDSGLRRAGTAYCIAYMRALLRRANEEVGEVVEVTAETRGHKVDCPHIVWADWIGRHSVSERHSRESGNPDGLLSR